MKVSKMAEMLNTTADTVRYYTQQGFLRPLKNPFNGYKDYDQNDINRLKFILSARALGFSVKDIGNILMHSDKGSTACPLVRNIIEQRLKKTESEFQHTLALRKRMKNAISQWRQKPDIQPTGQMICHLIEDFEES